MINLHIPFRQAVLDLPWVTEVRNPGRCVSLRSGAPLKVYWKRDGTAQDDPQLLDKWKCTKSGRYKFTALKRSYARDGGYCWQHLVYRAALGDMDEEARAVRWWLRTGRAERVEDPENSRV